MTKDNVPYRAPNFTHKEMETLIYHLELKPELIKPAARLNRDGVKMVKTSTVLTVNDKLKLWEEIAAELNKVGESSLTGIVRSATDVKRKWNDLKSRVKHKAQDIRSGKLPDKTPLSLLEDRVLYLIAKTSNVHGLNGNLPPAFLNMIDRKKQAPTVSSTSEANHSEDEEEDEPNTDEDTRTIEDNADDTIFKKPEIPKIVHPLVQSPPRMPAVSKIPIITFTTPIGKIIQTPTESKANNNLGSGSNASVSTRNDKIYTKDCDTQEVIEMIYSSQQELKNEIKNIKKIMIRISEQKRKRIEQENEKIQLKKMKLMLKCQKQGIDYDEFITDFM